MSLLLEQMLPVLPPEARMFYARLDRIMANGAYGASVTSNMLLADAQSIARVPQPSNPRYQSTGALDRMMSSRGDMTPGKVECGFDHVDQSEPGMLLEG